MTRAINHRLPVYAPPATRGACVEGTPMTGSRDQRMRGQAQCGALQCRHNLLVEESSSRPGRRHGGLAPEWTLSGKNMSAGAPSCSLDVADTGPKTAAETAKVMGMSTRRVEQIVKEFKKTHKALALARLGEEE
jgi:hypothetical protein